ncbi:MAG: LUD domain-containing protein [Prevotella sp.]|jgi:L-lactate dehydrogenase complex protein LldG|nr:LUD domain-containing protein [Prevotella sp.]MCI1782088.1 LUD domain-containing protein [Prevotella sp.]MCI1802011.1 LUD domain-containing protein [Prevotella sp.]MCI1816137.1 LUD domain-containing protein [Prevotella sp.]MCI1849134.1 LUD domain-containing protein [Prevotella sp.]
MKKEELFAKLRANTHDQFDMPDMHVQALKYADTLQQFIAMTKSSGGKTIRLKRDADLNVAVAEAYPDAKVIASNLPGIKADRNPDLVEDARDLNGTDVGVIRGEIGVAENACIWIPQTMKEKAVCFISENLVILLDEADVVDNMHEAYARIKMTDYGFGTFISGPSKTADIEQALVMGAQAARSVTVFLLS